eukprot:scaffold90_cov264-Pinguiococcus_pyrenoidosus.AAC.8
MRRCCSTGGPRGRVGISNRNIQTHHIRKLDSKQRFSASPLPPRPALAGSSSLTQKEEAFHPAARRAGAAVSSPRDVRVEVEPSPLKACLSSQRVSKLHDGEDSTWLR